MSPKIVCRRRLYVGGCVAATLLALGSCDYGAVTVVEPPPVQARTLTLTILPDSETVPVARLLGWDRGIPDAEVTLTRVEEAGSQVRTARSNATGVAAFDQANGAYTVDARRWLTPAEASRLGVTASDVVGFVGSERIDATSAPVWNVAVANSRRRGLIVSEWAFNYGQIPNVGTYRLGGFIELYNNGDTTVFVDRLIVGEAYNLAFATSYAPCADQVPFKRDPDYLWAIRMHQIPGSGRQYALQPGRTAVIATDAIDHRPIIANGLDLRSADFEFAGTADVDNPTVPNVVNIGFGADHFGHGFHGDILSSAFFIAQPLDFAALPRKQSPRVDAPYLGIPRSEVLEAIALQTDYEFTSEYCGDQLHPNFDRRTGRYIAGGDAAQAFVRSVERRVAFTRLDGRKVLQHTRFSVLDFVVGTRTPGRLP